MYICILYRLEYQVKEYMNQVHQKLGQQMNLRKSQQNSAERIVWSSTPTKMNVRDIFISLLHSTFISLTRSVIE